MLSLGSSDLAQETPPSEYQIKAAFIFNFARFVEWPPAALPEAKSPIVIGILGENPFKDTLEKTVRNKTVEDHPLVVKQFGSAAEASKSHILFISTSERGQLADLIKALEGSNVLTVGEMEQFNEKGGMINFVMEGTKMRFRINNQAATRAGLKISSKLLNLALP